MPVEHGENFCQEQVHFSLGITGRLVASANGIPERVFIFAPLPAFGTP